MKYINLLLILLVSLTSCQRKTEISSMNPVNWEKRTVRYEIPDSLIRGSTYLPVYSQIYQIHDKKTFDLTVTVSMRNISPLDSVFILKADYFNSGGDLIRTYFDKAVYLKPMETIEIVIDEADIEGGTGGNFMFDWAVKEASQEPLFESVMISALGQQGLSFITRGIKISD